jgi:hypothetical protein
MRNLPIRFREWLHCLALRPIYGVMSEDLAELAGYRDGGDLSLEP